MIEILTYGSSMILNSSILPQIKFNFLKTMPPFQLTEMTVTCQKVERNVKHFGDALGESFCHRRPHQRTFYSTKTLIERPTKKGVLFSLGKLAD